MLIYSNRLTQIISFIIQRSGTSNFQNNGKNLNANFLWMVGLFVYLDNRYLIDEMKTKAVSTFSFSTNWCCEIIKRHLDDLLLQRRFEIHILI